MIPKGTYNVLTASVFAGYDLILYFAWYSMWELS